MPIPTVWSERDDVVAGEHDCAYSSILMCLVYGGKTSYPDGIYTAKEREALERSDDRPDEQGASSDDIDTAISRRYGLAANTPADLSALLKVRGTAVSVGGQLSNFPTGHRLRRWAPTYTGGHRVCVLPRGDGSVRWLDPLAPFGYAGDIAQSSEVLEFSRGRLSSDARYVNQDQYASGMSGGIAGGIDTVGLAVTLPATPAAGSLAIPSGTDSIRVRDASHYKVPSAATRAAYTAELTGAVSGPGYLVDLDGDEMHFIRKSESGLVFVPEFAAAATKLAPGIYEVA